MTAPTSLRTMAPAALLEQYSVDDADIVVIRETGALLSGRLEQFISEFYTWLEAWSEHEEFFSDPATIAHLSALQLEYWSSFFAAEMDEAYLGRLRVLGSIHAHAGVSLEAYLASANRFLTMFNNAIRDHEPAVADPALAISAVTKWMQLSNAVVTATFIARAHDVIETQHQSLQELSTPVSVLWDKILILPIVGVVDSKRAQDIMDAMLEKIAETTARIMIVDIGGVTVIDTAVANHFIKITKATQLMGCTCVLSGVSPAIAETIVSLGINLNQIATRANLKGALVLALEEVGQRVVASNESRDKKQTHR